MRERKYVKFRVDMYSDTKLKIIDRRPERDLIHYVWNRIVMLAGKVNLEGELYLSKNIPYTIETLAIEFNRETEQIKLALDVLMELEMIGLNEHNIYIVTNFAKHQNIKVKDKNKLGNNEGHIESKEVEVKSVISKEDLDNENEISKNEMNNAENNSENKINQENASNVDNNANLSVIDKNTSKLENNISTERIDDNYKNGNVANNKNYQENKNNGDYKENNTILLEPEKSKRRYKKKNDNNIEVIDEETEDKPICFMSEGEETKHLRKDEIVIGQWSF